MRCHSGSKSLIFVVQSSFLIFDGRGVLFRPLAKSLLHMINLIFSRTRDVGKAYSMRILMDEAVNDLESDPRFVNV